MARKILFLTVLVLVLVASSGFATTGRVVTIDGINKWATGTGSIFGDSGTGYIYTAIINSSKSGDITNKIGSIQPFYWNNDPGLYELMTGAAVESLTDTLRSVYSRTKSTNSPLVIVSHSWGTVLAYIVLHNNPDIVVDKLITMGSPLETITPAIKFYTDLTLTSHGSFPVVALSNIKTWHNYWTLCDLISSTIGVAMNHQSDISLLDEGLCHNGYYENSVEWEKILTDVLDTQHPLATKFQKAYQNFGGTDVMGSPVNDIHDWGGYWVQSYWVPYWVQDYPDMPGFGRSIMIYNQDKDTVYIVHGDIWDQVYEPMGGVNSWLGLPTSNEYYPEADNNARQNFENGYITHKTGSYPYWQAYANNSQPSTPTIAQTDTGEDPPQYSPGQTFRQWGTGFTPNGYATLHFKKPDGSEDTPLSQPLDSIGHFDISYTPPLNKPEGRYTWWAIDNSTGKKSNVISYDIVSSTTSTRSITVLSPNGGERLHEGDDYRITWNSTTNIDKVRIELHKKDGRIKVLTKDLDGCSTLNVDNDGDRDFTWHISGFDDYSENYKIKLIARDFNSDCDTGSDVTDKSDYSFTIIRKPPAKVGGANISNGAVDQSIESVISWGKVADATSYEVYFGTSPDWQEYKGNQTFRTFDPGTLDYCTTYYWRIDSRNEGGVTRGNVWSFKTDKGLLISGRVVDENTGQPLAGIVVSVNAIQVSDWGNATTDANGNYTICGLTPGDYKIQTFSNDVYVDKYYDNVTVGSGSDTSNINFSLERTGSISGRVVDDNTGLPIAGLYVSADAVQSYQFNGWGSATTDANGNYTIFGLRAMDYRVQANGNTDYIGEYYNNTYNQNAAILVAVASGVNTAGINFGLERTGSISGRVIDENTGLPIAGLYVYANTVQWDSFNSWGSATTDANGDYKISGLRAGEYRVEVQGGNSYVDEYYNNAYAQSSATPVTVTYGVTTGGINFSLAKAGSISGRVVADDTGLPIVGVYVYVYASGSVGGSATTDSNGDYKISGLRAGDYQVEVQGNDTYDWNTAALVTVSSGNTSGINFSLARTGSISGRIIDENTGLPIAGLSVYANMVPWDSFNSSGGATTDADGNYTISGLRAGDYRIEVQGSNSYVGEYYNNTYDQNAATIVTVASGGNTGGINFSLAKGGSISGRVVDDNTGLPIEGIYVSACPYQDQYPYAGLCESATTDSNGDYKISGLRAGDYRITVQGNNSYVGEYYDNTYDWNATLVTVASGGNTGGINFGLVRTGSISGRVVDDNTGLPIEGIYVSACPYQDQYPYAGLCESATTDSNGDYKISGLRSGDYRIEVQGNYSYVGEYYNNTYDYSTATSVTVVSGVTTGGINFSLARTGSISGRVVDDNTGLPIEGIYVSACPYQDQYPYAGLCESATTDSNGDYKISGLRSGDYRIEVQGNYSYVGEYYNNTYDYSTATSVTVVSGVTTGGINFSLARTGSISGRVVDDNTGLPIEGIYVSACPYQDQYPYAGLCESATTDSNGDYKISGLRAGDYRITVQGNNSYVGEYYDNTYDWNATLVTVASGGNTGGINFGLVRTGSISGRVVDDNTGLPIEGIYVSACPYQDQYPYAGLCESATTDSNGDYKISGLRSGDYRIEVQGNYSYVGEYYNNTYDYSTATSVTVVSGVTTGGINFSLARTGSISGRVVDDNTGLPIEGIYVSACPYQDQYPYAGLCESATTDSNGDYKISRLRAGDYRITVQGNNSYVGEYYNNTYDYSTATSVTVAYGVTTGGINFGLERAGYISGRVVADDTGLPVAGVYVISCHYEPAPPCIGNNSCSGPAPYCLSATTDSNGDYTISGLLAGDYRIQVQGNNTYIGEYYDNSCDWNTSSLRAVTAGINTGGINFGLQNRNTIYCDSDYDGHVSSSTFSGSFCQPGCQTQPGDDCDDYNGSTYPGAPEQCDNQDNDCDGAIEENLTRETYCGVGVCGSTGIETCISGSWMNDTCTPRSPIENPEATCDDNLDNDCDGQTDEACQGECSWTETQEIASVPYIDNAISISVDSNGNRHIIYDDSGSIKYIKNTSVPITLIESDNQSWADNPSIAAGPSGELHVVYLKSNNTPPWSASIMYMNNSSGSWTAPQEIAIVPYIDNAISISVDSNGNRHIVYDDSDSIKYMNNTSVPITLIESDNQSWADNPSIAVGPSGELHVVYLKSNNAAPWSASIMYMNKTCPDSDGDGYSSDIDCDDSNAAINPGVTEIPNDGIDNDCNPATPVAVVSGSGMNYPVPGFSATMSVNVNDSNLSAGNLKYSYTRQKISLISTSITGISATGGTASVTGAGSMNGIAGYTFTATITDGSPDGMGIEVRKPDGTLYFREPSAGGTRAILRWGFNITGQ